MHTPEKKIVDVDRQIRVEFQPLQAAVTVPAGTRIIDAARILNIDLSVPCGGHGNCGKCLVRVTAGAGPASDDEKRLLPEQLLEQEYRLACRTCLTQDSVVEIPAPAREGHTTILVSGEIRQVALQPACGKQFLQVKPPVMDENTSDLELILSQCPDNAGSLSWNPQILAELPENLRSSSFSGTVVRHQNRLLAFEPGDTTSKLYGMAFDLGTTTVVGKLVDLNRGVVLEIAARLNPQRKFGDDVITRISYAQSQNNGAPELQTVMIQAMNEMIDELCEKTGVEKTSIYEIVVAGNTVMEHFLLGLNAKYLAEMPYIPTFRKAVCCQARDLGLRLHPEGVAYIFPIIGRYVGGDTSAVLLSLADRLQQSWLAVDIGTNGEILLCHNGKLWATSAAAGPAFEGAHIAQGMRAMPGAIERVLWQEGRLQVQVIGGGAAQGVCGSGLIDALGALLQSGGLDMTGRLQKDVGALHFFETETGPAVRLSEVGPVLLSQRDIRELQLAKSAIATAIAILLKTADVRIEQLDALYVAGAFGQYIRKDMAVSVGLLPALPLEKIHFIGNAAYSGAELALLSSAERRRAEQLAAATEYVEIATDPEFQDFFAENLMFTAA